MAKKTLTAAEKIKERKDELIALLHQHSALTDLEAITVADRVGKSFSTVKNYIKGNIPDGYLGEAILEELNSLKGR